MGFAAILPRPFNNLPSINRCCREDIPGSDVKQYQNTPCIGFPWRPPTRQARQFSLCVQERAIASLKFEDLLLDTLSILLEYGFSIHHAVQIALSQKLIIHFPVVQLVELGSLLRLRQAKYVVVKLQETVSWCEPNDRYESQRNDPWKIFNDGPDQPIVDAAVE